MKRGESAGGGQSSLGYLFGSDNKQKNEAPPPPSPTTLIPPYGVDIGDGKPPESPSSPLQKTKVSNSYQIQGPNSRIFITDRPSTKVNSVPGGYSSLGYLFGDK
ncbi:hypothetical protein ACS0TY_021730 [Phlomoides rotata]